MRNGRVKFVAVVAAFVMLISVMSIFTGCNNNTGGDNGGSVEFAYKGQTGQGSDKYMGDPCDVYWIDAAVQKPDTYTKIVGFKLTVKYKSAGYYGGWKDTQENPMGMLLLSKGAHQPNEYVFTYPNEQSPVYDLANKDIVTFCTGTAATYVVGTAFSNGKEVRASVGNTVTLEYEGTTALFTETDSVMTAVNFLGSYEFKSVEWILGEPEKIDEQPWDKVETQEWTDVATVAPGKQNGNNYIDITIPKTNKESYPVILWIHGGGYITGNRKSVLLHNNKDYLLAQGYAFVSVEYTLTEKDSTTGAFGKAGMPQMLYDIKAAVRFLRANAATYKLNTDFIAAMGESAGAGLAVLMATTNSDCLSSINEYMQTAYAGVFATLPSYEDKTMGNSEYSSDVQAAIGVCAPTVFDGEQIGNLYALFGSAVASYGDEYREALSVMYSPYNIVCADTAPMYLANSHADDTVPILHGLAMREALEEQEVDFKAAFYQQGGHVDRSVFDAYSSYVDIATWVNGQRDKVLNK